MHRSLLYIASLSLALLRFALESGIIDAAHAAGSVRDASSAIAAPDATTTYISELAPTVSRSLGFDHVTLALALEGPDRERTCQATPRSAAR